MAERTVRELWEVPKRDLLEAWASGVLGADPKDLVSAQPDLDAAFRTWAKSNLQSLCVDWRYCERKTEQQGVALAAAVADYIMQQLDIPTPFTVAALLVKHTFDSLCECDHAPPAP